MKQSNTKQKSQAGKNRMPCHKKNAGIVILATNCQNLNNNYDTDVLVVAQNKLLQCIS